MSPATRSTQRFCPECGSKVTKAQKFCRECGTALQPAAAGATEEIPSPTARTSAPPPAEAEGLPAEETTLAAEIGLPWPAWVGVGACGVLVVAAGLPWFGGGFSADGFDIPLAALFSDGAEGGVPLAVLFLLTAAAGVAVALISPAVKPLRLTFIIAGAVSAVFTVWYMIRILSTLDGAPLLDALSIGFWLAFLSSIGILVGGLALRMGKTARTVNG